MIGSKASQNDETTAYMGTRGSGNLHLNLQVMIFEIQAQASR